MADIMRAVGCEIADLGQLACSLQLVVGSFGPAPGQKSQAIEALQGLDLLTQRLQGVAAYLNALTPGLPESWTSDAATAARAITLSDLAQRLGRPSDDMRGTKAEESGAFELF